MVGMIRVWFPSLHCAEEVIHQSLSKRFVELVGVSKANSSVDYAMLEYCIREDLKIKKARMMAVLDPIKLVIDNYPEGQIEELDVPNNLENQNWEAERFHSAVKFISKEKTLWKNRRRNISVSSREMKYVLWALIL